MTTAPATAKAVLPERVVVVGPIRDPEAPLDFNALRARGYTHDEAYALLRRHGVQVPGGRRRRISVQVLEAIERGERAP